MNMLVATAIALVALAALLRWPLLKRSGLGTVQLTALFSAKILATVALQALYTFHYTDRATADIYRFYDDGVQLRQILNEAPADGVAIFFGFETEEHRPKLDRLNCWLKPYESGFYNDNKIMVRLHTAISYFSGSRYEVAAVLFTLLSFVGLLLLLLSFNPRPSPEVVAMAMLLPSSLLWLSGPLKESLVMFGLGLFLFGWFRRSAKGWLLVLLAVIVLIQVKVYWLVALMPALFSYEMLNKKSSMGRQWAAWIMVITVCAAMVYWLGYDWLSELARKQSDFVAHANQLQAGSFIPIKPLLPSLSSFAASLPTALLRSVFAPFPAWPQQPAEMLLAAESLIVFGFLLVATIKHRRINSLPLQIALPVLLLIGLTTPVLGALMRYRAPALVLMLLAVAHYVRTTHKSA